jgi:hypothetical protein
MMDVNEHNTGYDAATGKFCDLVKAGIIDPLKVSSYRAGWALGGCRGWAFPLPAMLGCIEACILCKPCSLLFPRRVTMRGQ